MKIYVVVGRNDDFKTTTIPVLTCSYESAVQLVSAFAKNCPKSGITFGVLAYDVSTQGKNINKVSYPLPKEKVSNGK